MSRLFKILFYIICVITFNTSVLYSQESAHDGQQLQNEIKIADQILGQSTDVITQRKMAVIERCMKNRQEYINLLSNEIYQLNYKIDLRVQKIALLELEINKLKKEYSKLIYTAYKSHVSQNYLLYLFTSNDIFQAYMRIKYLQQCARYRRDKALLLQRRKIELNQSLAELQKQKELKRQLLDQKYFQVSGMELNSKRKNRLLTAITNNRDLFFKDLKRREDASDELRLSIERTVEDYKNTTENNKIDTLNFESNKAKLPWPTQEGIVTAFFGIHEHPYMKNIKIQNDGIEISTLKNAAVKSVFGGTVADILEITGNNHVVLINHGNYYTLYANLENIVVRKGQKIGVQQLLGYVFTETHNEDAPAFQFQIWFKNQKLNPLDWLRPKF